MIVIDKIEQLEKYKTNTAFINENGIKHLTTYQFIENGNLADVVFNIEINFEININIPNDIDDLFAIPNIEKEENIDCVAISAKSIYAKKTLKVGIITADSLFIAQTCDIYQDINIKKNIQGNKLVCEFLSLTCENINCNILHAENICCKKLAINELLITSKFSCNRIKAENVNFFEELYPFDN